MASDNNERDKLTENEDPVVKRDFSPEKRKITPQLPLLLRDKPNLSELMKGVYSPKQILEMSLSKKQDEPWFQKGWIYGIFGMTKSGKTHLFRWLLYEILQAGKAPGAYWHIDYVKAMSSSAKMSGDLSMIPREQIVDHYDHAWLNALAKRNKEIAEHMNEIGSKKTPPHTLVVMDDMIGAIEADYAMNMRRKQETTLWEALATGGRRLNISLFMLLQKFQFNINTVRDNMVYVIFTQIPTSGIEYIYAKMKTFGFWENEREFVQWCASILIDYQAIIFYMLALDWRDSFRIVKAPSDPPPRVQIKLVRKQQTKDIQAYTEEQAKQAEAEEEEADDACWIS